MRKLDNRIATLIRIDEELYEDIKCLAERDNRSINKQIEFILKLYVEKEWDVSKDNDKLNQEWELLVLPFTFLHRIS